MLGDVVEEVVGLFDGAEVGADGDLDGVREAEQAHCLFELSGRGVLSELADEGGRYAGDDLVALVDGLDELEDLALVRDGGEGAVHKAHAAGDALVVVDLGAAALVGADGVHAAGLGAGALDAADGVIGALGEAAAAFNAFLLVDLAFAVPADGYCALGADVHAGVGEAALAVGGNADLLGRASVAGKGDDVYEGRLIVLFRLGRLFDTVGSEAHFRRGAQGQTAGEAEPLRHDGALEEDVMPVLSDLAGDDLIGQGIDP